MSNTTASSKGAALSTDSGPCYRLLYRSHSLLPSDNEDDRTAQLAEILRVARTNNAKLGVTGALMLYDDWFAQVLEGPKGVVEDLFGHIRKDTRHEAVRLDQADAAPKRLFEKWAMAVVAEHHEPDAPMVATKGGLSEGAPWKVSLEQEAVLTRLRDLTRGYGRGS